ncbi:MAG: phosphate acyltransferase PlsX [Candidatus Omnitrophica bacterium]|nr:phosphate acyltransferase PlsX [Candidatus Omnitrophota bacterium]
MKVVVDAMGGDHAPVAIVAGAVEAVKEFDVEVTLVGIEEEVRRELKKYSYPQERIKVIHAPETVAMDESATVVVRKKRNSSISIGVDLLKDNSEYKAFISAGNTGAVVAASTILLGMLPGVERPAIGLVIPTLNRFSFLIDVGANPDPKPHHLLQSALMANVYTNEILEIANPKIGLLNIGEESTKGTDFVKETHKMMSERLPNFMGNVEPNELFSGKFDCIICDGFVGNALIKVSQGLMESAGALLKREIKKSPIAMLGAFLMKSRLEHIKRYADYSEYGGAPLLGVNGNVMISHGRSGPKAIKNAIRAGLREAEHGILTRLRKEIEG